MPRIATLTVEQTPDAARPALDAVQKAMGFVPNMFKTMAHSPVALGGYLHLNQAMQRASLSARDRESVALAVSQVNGCDYCLTAHSLAAKRAGLDLDAIHAARQGEGEGNPFATLARQIAQSRGHVGDADLAAARAAGITDAQIVDVIAVAALLTLTNYLNSVAATEVDFPSLA